MAGASLLMQIVSFAPLALAVCLCLMRADVLPGGWRLAHVIENRYVAKARERAWHGLDRLEQIRAAQRSTPEGAVLWIGSSTVEMFPVRQHWPRTPHLNAGIAATRADHLARLLPQLLPPLPLGGVVVIAGTADRLALPRAPEQAAAAAERLLDALRRALPTTPIVVVGPLPEREPAEGAADTRAEVQTLRAHLREAAAQRGLAFVDAAQDPLVDEQFRLRRECSVDEVHLSPMGYAHLARMITAVEGPVGALLRP